MTTKTYHAALYMRLSKDDDTNRESVSISTQRAMLRAYAVEHHFSVYKEYIDDGFSGTNFNRPAWQSMIRDIEENKVNLVITKDLSRLGRDYITTGQVTERYFPQKGVRYIAINDGYDSIYSDTDIAPFKNILNEMYARDTSRKIRSALQSKMKAGAFIGNFAPFGYQKDPNDKNHLVIDPVSSPVVQKIFQMAKEGFPPSQIANALNAQLIFTPAAYRYFHHMSNDSPPPHFSGWTSSMVCKLLQNPVYVGDIVQGKSAKLSFKSRTIVQKPREDWIVVKNQHAPIVPRKIFLEVHNRCVSRRRPPTASFQNIFSGIARCADCGHTMSSAKSRGKNGEYLLVCGNYKQHGKSRCSSHAIHYSLLYDTILEEILRQLNCCELTWKQLVLFLNSTYPQMETIEQGTLQKREKELDAVIKRLYEDNAAGRLDSERFHRLLKTFTYEQDKIVEQRKALQSQLSFLPSDKAEVPVLTAHLLRTFVSRIEIGQGIYENEKRQGIKRQSIQIHYKFAAPYKDKTA